METVVERRQSSAATASTLEQERLRMQNTLIKAATENPTNGVMRGTRRFNSSNGHVRMAPARSTSFRGTRPLAPTKSNDTLSSMRGNAVARANSSRALLRATSSGNVLRGPNHGIRPFSRDQIVNTGISRSNSNDGMKMMSRFGPGGSTLQREMSELSLGDFSSQTSGDASLFTMDSVNLRKTQLVADPLDNDGTYDEEESFADHDSFVTRQSDATFFRQHAQEHNVVLTYGDIEAMRNREKVQIASDECSHLSFGTINSGLTNDYTEDHDFSEDETAIDE